MKIGLIGGTGAQALVPATATPVVIAKTGYGETSGPVQTWRTARDEFFFLPRHGRDGHIAPHAVNYRANVKALAGLEPDRVIGINVVGGISPDAVPGRLVFPSQLIDYTWGRAHTFDGVPGEGVRHIEFTEPLTPALRAELVQRAIALGLDPVDGGTYGATQGPRLETAAEIDRLERDGCTIVGMTAMPEASLAREADLRYAICALVVNLAAGRGREPIHAEIARHLAEGMSAISRVLDLH